MKRMAIAFAAAIALASPWVAAQVYKWVDENGKVQYGEQPPPGAKATPINVPAAPAGAPAQQTWKEKELESQRRKNDRERQEAQEDQQARQRNANREANCYEANRRLAILREQVPAYTRNSKGERVYVEDNARPAEIAKAEAYVRENCK
ncbi:hypothetical protein BWI17_19055 [Betaproteobacteria bacterium GR16-43]|nr:hypothetical protein BWI17_19055 [Betaproteobacteria bacterium GR16-43]